MCKRNVLALSGLGPLLLAGVLAVIPANRAAADGIENHSGNYGAHIGYSKSQGAEQGEMLFGGHIELNPAPWFGLQGAVDYRSEERIRLSTSQGDQTINVKTIPVTASARLYLPFPGGFSPFASAGAGWYRQVYDFPPAMEGAFGLKDRSESSFGWHVGAGADIAFAPQVSLYGEGRFIFLDPKRDFGGDVQQEIRNIDYDSSYLAGGMSIHF